MRAVCLVWPGPCALCAGCSSLCTCVLASSIALPSTHPSSLPTPPTELPSGTATRRPASQAAWRLRSWQMPSCSRVGALLFFCGFSGRMAFAELADAIVQSGGCSSFLLLLECLCHMSTPCPTPPAHCLRAPLPCREADAGERHRPGGVATGLGCARGVRRHRLPVRAAAGACATPPCARSARRGRMHHPCCAAADTVRSGSRGVAACGWLCAGAPHRCTACSPASVVPAWRVAARRAARATRRSASDLRSPRP